MTNKLITPRVELLLTTPKPDVYQEVVVQTTNQDLTGYDLARSRQKWPLQSEAPMFWLTWISYSAMKRSGQPVGTFEQFNERCVQIRGVNDDGSYKTKEQTENPDDSQAAEVFPKAPVTD